MMKVWKDKDGFLHASFNDYMDEVERLEKR
jgi:hypothetical protein